MAVRPLADRVLIERIEENEQKSAGGIIIPDTAKEKPQQGTVVSVGPGKVSDDGKRVAMEVKEGQRVLFGKYSGTDIKVDGRDMLIMHENDILAIFE